MNASQGEFLQKTAKETKVRIGFATSSLSSLPSVYSFQPRLLRIGWQIKRESRGSRRILSLPSWSDVVFAI
jgi:hypothetical protein